MPPIQLPRQARDEDELVFRDRAIMVGADRERYRPLRQAAYLCLHSREGRCVMGNGFYNSPLKYGTLA